MPRRRRTILLALLALAIPLPALAFPGERDVAAPPAPATLAVSTALDSCGVADSQVVCKLDVGFNAIPGATSYTASVTRADGSVVDYGSVGAGGGSLWVPYTGSGTYSVRISAYGTPPETESGGNASGNELITSEATEADAVDASATGNSEPDENPGAGTGGEPTEPNAAPVEDPGAEPNTPDGPSSSCEPQPAPEEEPLPEPPPTDLDPNDPDEDRDGIDDAEERAAFELALSERTAAALAAEAELPDAIECAEPVRP